MNCTLQIFLNDAWIDCAQIEGEDNRCHWNSTTTSSNS